MIEDWTDYGDSEIWNIQTSYFAGKGPQAWLGGDIPYEIANNPCYALQVLHLVLAHWRETGSLEEYNILELGAGLGNFAWHFLTLAKALQNRIKIPLYSSLRYVVSDNVPDNVVAIQNDSRFQSFVEDGVMRALVVDAFAPPSTPDRFDFVIENYLHCVLPMRIIRKMRDRYLEKQTRMRRNPDVEELKFDCERESPINGNIYDQVEIDERFVPIMMGKMDDVVSAQLNAVESGTLIYPEKSCDHLEMMKTVLSPTGLIIISDKGYVDDMSVTAHEDFYPTNYGSSLAYGVNFPLLARFSRKEGYGVLRTDCRVSRLHTMLLASNGVLSELMKKVFDNHFIHQNVNDRYCGKEEFSKRYHRYLKKFLFHCRFHPFLFGKKR